MKRKAIAGFAAVLLLLSMLFIAACVQKGKKIGQMTPPVTFKMTADEVRIEEMHAKVFKQLGGYKGPEACYACHQKEYKEISSSYHVHQGRITKDGEPAYNPKDAVDVGMFTRWYPLSNLDRTVEDENDWRQMEGIFCAQCHPGGGFLKEYKMDVDCLICHQKSGYRGGQGFNRSPAGVDKNGKTVFSDGARTPLLMMAGAEAAGDMKKIDLSNIAVKMMENTEVRVGKPTPDNCNFCHWRTNGKRGTKYGLFKNEPTDVHYAAGIACQECHVTKAHLIGKGKIVDAMGTPELRGTMKKCADCHGENPHSKTNHTELDDHIAKMACEVCHIPKTYPGIGKVNWTPGMDMAGMMKKYKWMMPIAKLMGMATPEAMNKQIDNMMVHYKTMKKPGFKPVYAWYNSDVICKDIPHPTGSKDDEGSKITPFSVVETILFDDGSTPEVVKNPDGHASGHPVPKTFVARAGGKGKKDTKIEDMHKWNSGKYASSITRNVPMYFQQFHSIAPAKDALTCDNCHTKKGGALDFAALGYSPDEVEELTAGY